ncbi:MAG: hypothetical protein II852_01730 [Bacteroidales bacterium]|nr:hypothetical protein [Bacteroidales bacterium]
MKIGNTNNGNKGISLAHLSNQNKANSQTNKGNNSNNTIWFILVAAVVIGIFVYNNRSKTSQSTTYPASTYSGNNQQSSNSSTGSNTSKNTSTNTRTHTTEICPMCNGSGIFEYMPGDIMAPREKCTGCNGTGRCDSETAKSIREMQQNVNNMFGMGGNSTNSGYQTNTGQRICTECNGTGLVVVDKTHPDRIGLGLHPHEYAIPDPGCTIIHCNFCGKNHCSEVTRHANCTACRGTGKR